MIVAYYFTADWCAPCKKVRPIVENINKDSITKFQIIDVDSETELVRHFKIKSIPTFILIDNGIVVNQVSGPQTKEQLFDFINV